MTENPGNPRGTARAFRDVLTSKSMIGSPAANPSPQPAPCAFCQHVNPADSKFCNACGAPLPLVPCARCGAVNDPGATACYQCGAPLHEAGGVARPAADEASGATGFTARTAEGGGEPRAQPSPGAEGLDGDAKVVQELQRLLAGSDSDVAAGPPEGNSLGIAKPDADLRTSVTRLTDARRSYPAPAVASPTTRSAPRILPHRRTALIVATLVLAVLAAGGYYAYRERPVPDVPAASGAVKDAASPAATGALVDPPVGAGGAAPLASTPALAITPRAAADDQPVAPASESGVAAVRPGTTVPGDAPSPATTSPARSPGTATSPRRPGAEARDPSEGAAAVPAAVARPRSAAAAPGIIEAPPRVGPCTEAVAALGLCAPEAVQRRE